MIDYISLRKVVLRITKCIRFRTFSAMFKALSYMLFRYKWYSGFYIPGVFIKGRRKPERKKLLYSTFV